jgi:trehalose 6-phosphate phosphatase
MSRTVTDDPSRRLTAALAAIAGTPALLLALDFDGTLAPLVDDPMTARALPEVRATMTRLAELAGIRLALVSGRSLDSLRIVAEELPPGVLLVGSHGAELWIDGELTILPIAEADHALLGRLAVLLDGVAAEHPGVHVEYKPAGAAMHTRLADPATAQRAVTEALAGAAELPGLTPRTGKDILEFSVHAATKGEGIEYLRHAVGATAVLFIGDDVTDEDGFAVLRPGDLGIKVGPGPTRAGYRVADPFAVAELLGKLLDLRTRR